MSDSCTPTAQRITEGLGFDCHDRNPILSVRNPFDLENGTMPFLELLIIIGALWALVHAWRRWRRDGDPVGISIWGASLAYLAVVEPPLYFPEWFGLDKQVGFIFSHNVFSVQFMFDRLPLYIVCFYPAIATLAWEIVRSLRIVERRGAIVAGLAVAFVCQVFYEIFDQLGPQLKWWAWNMENKEINEPALASVPMGSMLLFASVSFGALTWLVLRFVGEREGRGTLSGGAVLLRTIAAGVLTPLAMIVFNLPTAPFRGQYDVLRGIASVELGIIWAIGIVILIDVWRAHSAGAISPIGTPTFARFYPMAYLDVHLVLWAFALPDYFDAEAGITGDGTPIGSLAYVIACTVASLAIIATVWRVTTPSQTAAPDAALEVGLA